MANETYTGIPFDSDDQRALAYWVHVAVLTNNQAEMQRMLVAEGTGALQVYDDFNALLRKDQLADGPADPIDTRSPRWNNSAGL